MTFMHHGAKQIKERERERRKQEKTYEEQELEVKDIYLVTLGNKRFRKGDGAHDGYHVKRCLSRSGCFYGTELGANVACQHVSFLLSRHGPEEWKYAVCRGWKEVGEGSTRCLGGGKGGGRKLEKEVRAAWGVGRGVEGSWRRKYALPGGWEGGWKEVGEGSTRCLGGWKGGGRKLEKEVRAAWGVGRGVEGSCGGGSTESQLGVASPKQRGWTNSIEGFLSKFFHNLSFVCRRLCCQLCIL